MGRVACVVLVLTTGCIDWSGLGGAPDGDQTDAAIIDAAALNLIDAPLADLPLFDRAVSVADRPPDGLVQQHDLRLPDMASAGDLACQATKVVSIGLMNSSNARVYEITQYMKYAVAEGGSVVVYPVIDSDGGRVNKSSWDRVIWWGFDATYVFPNFGSGNVEFFTTGTTSGTNLCLCTGTYRGCVTLEIYAADLKQ